MKKVNLPTGEAVSFKKAFALSDSRKHFFLIDGKWIQNYIGTLGNKEYCETIFTKAISIYGPVRFDTAKRLALKDAGRMRDVARQTVQSFGQFRRKK